MEYLKIKEVAETFKTSEKTVLKLIRERHIKAFKFSRQWMVSREAINEYIKKRSTEARA